VNYESLYENPDGRTSRSQFLPALLVLAAVAAFFGFVVKGRTATFCMLVLMYPWMMLHARRLRDMGRSAWLLVLPAVPMLATLAVWLNYASFGGQLDAVLPWMALLLAAAVAAWGAVGQTR
jgi:uncharacterized membrane protein YhaH (DUF805 family)